MNVLDENIPDHQRALLSRERAGLQQIGQELGRKGMKDTEIATLLHQLDRPTLLTQDKNFFDRGFCHERYCIVYLDVKEDDAAEFARRVLRHRLFKTKADRMGCVIRAHPAGLTFWQVRHEQQRHVLWK